MHMNKIIVYPIAAAVVAGGLGFWGGTMYSDSKAPANAAFGQNRGGFADMSVQGMQQRFGGAGGQGGYSADTRGGTTRGGGSFGGMTVGEVLSKDGQSLTVKMPDGSSRIVFYSDTTTVQKTSEGSIDDVDEGTTVRVTGSANDDGSITAQEVQVLPGGEEFFFGGQRGQVPQ